MKITKDERMAIDEFQQRLILKDRNKIDAIILYGSIIHGRYHSKESDIDIMVMTNEKSIDEDVLELETAISLKYGVVISALVATEKELREAEVAGYQFPKEVMKGKIIYERSKGRIKTGPRNI